MANFKKHSTGWEYRLKYKDPFTQQFKEKSQRGFSTKKEAQKAAEDFERKLAKGLEQIDLPFVDYLFNWVENYKKGVVRKNTLKIHMNNITNHIAPYFKKIMLREVKPDMYQIFLDKLLGKGLSKRSVEIIHTTVYGALERAVLQNKIERNPCKGAIIKGEKKKKELKFIDSGDIPTLLQAAYHDNYIYWIFFKVLIETECVKEKQLLLNGLMLI